MGVNNLPSEGTIQARIMNKRDTVANWTALNPLLLQGEYALVDIGLNKTRIKIGDGVTSFINLPYFDESAGAFQGIAVPSTVPNVLSGNVWYFGGVGTYVNFLQSNGQPIIVSSGVAILAFKAGSWTKLDLITPLAYTLTRLTVRSAAAGGIIGTNCMYLTITAAYAAVTGNDTNHRYLIEVYPGTYVEAGPDNLGLNLNKDYVDIIGMSIQNAITQQDVIIKGIEAGSSGVEDTFNTMFVNARCNLRNLKIIGFKNLGCIYTSDPNDYDREIVFEDCKFIHYGGFGSNTYREVYAIPYHNQTIRFKNCQGQSAAGIFMQNTPNIAYRNNTHAFNILFEGSKFNNFNYTDNLCYSKDKLSFINSEFDTLRLDISLTTFNANVGNAEANVDGRAQLSQLFSEALKIGFFDVTTLYKQHSYLIIPFIPGHNKVVTNFGGSAIADIGYAVQRTLPASAVLGSYSAGDNKIQTEKYQLYPGSGKVDGFSEQAIASNANGTIRLVSDKGKLVKVVFSTTNGSSLTFGAEMAVDVDGKVMLKGVSDKLIGWLRSTSLISSTYVYLEIA